MESLIFSIALVAVFISYFWLFSNKKVNLPGPKGWPYPFESIDFSNPQFTLHKWATAYGNKFRFSFVGNEFASFSDWKFMKHVLENRKIYEMPTYFREAITFRSGPSMFTAEGDLWKKKHHVLEPLFHNKMMKHHFNKISQKLEKLQSIIENSEEILNVVPLLHRFTIDIIGAVAFGIDVETLENPQKKYTDVSGKISENLFDLFSHQHDAVSTRIAFPIKFLWNLPLPVFQKEAELFKILENLLEKTIVDHENQIFEQEKLNKEFEGTDLITLLLESNVTQNDKKHFYTRADMIGECYSIFRAGEDTTATEASFILYELAKNPEIQEKIRAEIREIAESNGQNVKNFVPKFEDLNKLRYVDHVIKETTRMHPTAAALFREAVQEDTFDGIHIPKGTTVLLDVYSYYRSEAFPEPEKFKPERWESETAQFTSFGAGSRSCYGRKLAFLELRTLIVFLMQNFKLSTVPERPLEMINLFGMRPKKDQLFIKFEHL